MTRLWVGTDDGLHVIGADGERGEPQHVGRAVTALGRGGDAVWAILDGSELWRAADDEWTRAADVGGLRGRCVASIDGQVFVGTSEAHLLRLNGEALQRIDAFDAVEGREAWYTPWGGPPDTRSMTNWDEDTYVNVHVGGIVHTPDGGVTWSPTIDIDADVHQVTTAEGLVLAACAGGLATSRDGGATWSYRTDGLDAVYSRAVAVCGDVLLLSASTGPRGGRAAVYRGGLENGPFERCDAGPGWFDDNVDSHCLDAMPDGPLAAFGSSDGRLFATTDQGTTWVELASGLGTVTRVLPMP
jgi:hypothetical protein